jgi:glucose/mannose-6-phosphate isomerase
MSVITHELSLENFHEQLTYVLANYHKHGKSVNNYNNIVIGGLGGSGIGGRIARLAFMQEMPVPVEVFSEYGLPAYANNKTLVILCSYSGNTEETLSMFAQAQQRGCDMICVAASGQLKSLAENHGLPFYSVALGYQPRMTLGFGLGTLVMILGELMGKDMTSTVQEVESMFKSPANIVARAKDMYNVFKPTIAQKFVVVCDLAYEAVAIRFCQQIQENAKGEGFVSVLPEANHNMIESYYEKHDTNFIFLNSGNNARVTARFDFLKGVLSDLGNVVYHYPVSDASLKSQFEVIHATDWLSIWASNDKQVDNMQVGIIMKLKGHLENLK